MTFLTELERLKSAATNGPWQALPEECDKPYIRIRGTMLGCRYKIANVVTPVYDGVHEREAKETRANAALICFLVNHADALAELVRAAEKQAVHRVCEDSWYSCPKSPEGCANPGEGEDCNCGTDELINAIAKLNGAEK